MTATTKKSPFRLPSRLSFFAATLCLGFLSLLAASVQTLFAQQSFSNTAVVLTLDGPVTPASATYLTREIKSASDNKAKLILIEIDTPGGLVTSMQDIIQSILASDTPVVTYVSPEGARSASAGLYIMYAAHISAMAPATNTGAATPIEIGGADDSDKNPLKPIDETAPDEGTEKPAAEDIPALGNEDALRKKVINDSVAYIRSLAEKRGRNADWAESAVREAASISSNEALELGVIDLIAKDRADLLTQINGKVVETPAGDVTIDTSSIVITETAPALWERILAFFADPNVAAILLTLGTTGLIAEIWNPGSIFPGTFGLICLLLALYSFSVLPYNALALALMGVGILMVILEAYTPTFGFVGLAGLAVFGGGLYFLYPDAYRVSPALLGTVLAIGAAFLGFILFAVVQSRSHGLMIGGEAIRRKEGIVDDWEEGSDTGHVIIEGERWKARSSKPLKKGDRIRVTDVDGLVLVVKTMDSGANLSRFVLGKTA